MAELTLASDSIFGMIGSSTDPNDVDFRLFYDSRMKQACLKLTLNEIWTIRNSPFNISKATKVLIHGLIANTFDDFLKVVKNAYLENQSGNEYNIIVVNWSKLAAQNQSCWFDVLKRATTAGTRVTDFLLWLQTSMRLDLRRSVHIVGHWFGAHLAGMVGKNLIAEGQRLGRITALDPRDPGYFAGVHSRRLEKNDAAFVDVYHTNASTIDTSNTLGHVDFFVNKSTATPLHFPDNTKCEDKNSIAHRMFAQSIIDGPYGNNVTSQISGFTSNSDFASPASIIVGEYCIPGTNGWFDCTY